jgi:predicted MFS family arabinose efflux permease
VGFAVFGTFTYSGKLLQEITGFSVLASAYSVPVRGRNRPGRPPRAKAQNEYWGRVLLCDDRRDRLFGTSDASRSAAILFTVVSLFFFGVAFIFLQSTLVASAQDDCCRKSRERHMSMASLNMFVGGAVGTAVNAGITSAYGTSRSI